MLHDKEEVAKMGNGIFCAQSVGAGHACWAYLRHRKKLAGDFMSFQKFARWYRNAKWKGEFDQGCVMGVSGWMLSDAGIVSPSTAMVIPRSLAMMLANGNEKAARDHFIKLCEKGVLDNNKQAEIAAAFALR